MSNSELVFTPDIIDRTESRRPVQTEIRVEGLPRVGVQTLAIEKSGRAGFAPHQDQASALLELQESAHARVHLIERVSQAPRPQRRKQKVFLSLKDVFLHQTLDILSRAEVNVVTLAIDNDSKKPFELHAKTFERIPANSALELGPTGLTIYRKKTKAPDFIEYRIMIMEVDTDIRTAGKLLQEVQDSEEYKAIYDKVAQAVAAGHPVASLLNEAGDLVINMIGRIMARNKDDQMIYIAGTFENIPEAIDRGLITHDNRVVRVSYQLQEM